MKKTIGYIIAKIGALLWEKGGFWNESQRYEDCTLFGKLGYNMLCTGLKIMGCRLENLNDMVNLEV